MCEDQSSLAANAIWKETLLRAKNTGLLKEKQSGKCSIAHEIKCMRQEGSILGYLFTEAEFEKLNKN